MRRALAQAGAANRADRTTAEFLEQQRAQALAPITRRRFVGISAAGAAATLAGCATTGAGRAPRSDPVLIVGAGIAGLTAAQRLRQAGVPVRVFEAQNRVGGRMFSLRDFFADGQVCELGGELIDTNHAHIRALAAELELPLDDLSQEAPDVATDFWYFGGARRTEIELVDGFRPMAARLAADNDTLGGDVTWRTPVHAAALDRLTIDEWLERNDVNGWLRDLFRVAYTTEYGLETDQQSALNLLLLIDSDPSPFRIFGESDERFHVRGGNDSIPRRLAERLEDAIEPATVLEAVRVRAGGDIVCSFKRNSGGFDAASPDVILALPFTLLRQVRIDAVLPPAKRRVIDELGYGTNAKLMVGFSSRLWRERYRSNGSVFSDLPFQLTWETSRAQPGAAGILTNFTGGHHGEELGAGTPAARAADLVRDLEHVFPGIAAQRAGMREVRMHWPTHPWTQGSYSCYRPGQWTAFRGIEGEPVGRLYFAGEHCSLAAQGFMEGGCETGERVAREVLRARGRRVGAKSRRGLLLAGTRAVMGRVTA